MAQPELARKAYKDFPWLWAICPRFGWDVHVHVLTLESGRLYSEPFTGAVGCALWAKHTCQIAVGEGVREIQLDPAVNLAENILGAYPLDIGYMRITHLVLDHGAQNSKRVLTVMRSPRGLDVNKHCLEVATSTKKPAT